MDMYNHALVSAPFAGLSFRYELPPTLYEVSGCEGSGAGTFHCVGHADVLTLVGVDFRWLGRLHRHWQSIVLRVPRRQLGAGARGAQRYPPRDLLVPLARSYFDVLQTPHFDGVVLPFRFQLSDFGLSAGAIDRLYTNAVSVSFSPLPAPVIVTSSTYNVGPCARPVGNDRTTLSDCEPVYSRVVVLVHYGYDLRVQVGGMECDRVDRYP